MVFVAQVRVDVPAGTVSMYSSRLYHRGGANRHAQRERVFAFFTLAEPDAPAYPHRIAPNPRTLRSLALCRSV
jgi:hypothetical protein